MSFNVDIQGHHTNDAVSIQLLIQSVDEYNDPSYDEELAKIDAELEEGLTKDSLTENFRQYNSILITGSGNTMMSIEHLASNIINELYPVQDFDNLEVVLLDPDEESLFKDKESLLNQRIVGIKKGLEYIDELLKVDKETYVFINDCIAYFYANDIWFKTGIEPILENNPLVHIICLTNKPESLCDSLVSLFECIASFSVDSTKQSKLLFSTNKCVGLSDGEYMVSYNYGQNYETSNLDMLNI